MAGRKIRPNARSITGRIPSDKKPGMIAHESKLERDLILLLDFDSRVRTIEEQPGPIHFQIGKKRHRYTPDLRVTFWPRENLRPTYLEAKYFDDLRDNWAYLHPRLRAGFRHARSEGSDFHIVTERDIPTTPLRNIKRLWPYRKTSIDPVVIESIVGFFREFRRSTPEAMLRQLATDDQSRATYLAGLWYCLANRIVGFELEAELSPNSRIWLMKGEGPGSAT